MNMSWFFRLTTPRALLPFSLLVLAGCSSGPERPKPAELAPNVALVGVRQVWTTRVSAVTLPLQIAVSGNRVAVVSDEGTVALLDARTGADVWRATVGAKIAVGVGTDGSIAAVVTRDNELVTLSGGRELWRQRLPAQSFTAPLVAGDRVFVLTADRQVSAFDGQTGRRLWLRSRPSEPLVLRQAGLLMAVGDTLVAGLSGRLVGINPNNGTVVWEAAIASPRGANDLDRLVDLMGGVSRVGSVVCARAYQSNVGCVDARRGTLLWTRVANGANGIHGDENFLIGTEPDGRIVTWNRANGETGWSSDRLRFRGLTAPLVVGRSVAIGDSTGLVHLLSRTDGAPSNRLSTDGSAVAATPILAGQTLVVVTRNGNVFGFAPE